MGIFCCIIIVFFCRRPLPFGGSHLTLPSGPAGIRTTTGSLSVLARPTPYQLSHRVAFCCIIIIENPLFRRSAALLCGSSCHVKPFLSLQLPHIAPQSVSAWQLLHPHRKMRLAQSVHCQLQHCGSSPNLNLLGITLAQENHSSPLGVLSRNLAKTKQVLQNCRWTRHTLTVHQRTRMSQRPAPPRTVGRKLHTYLLFFFRLTPYGSRQVVKPESQLHFANSPIDAVATSSWRQCGGTSSIVSSPRKSRFVLVPIRFASEAWPRLQALETRDLFQQQNRKGKIVITKASRQGLVLGSFSVPEIYMIFGDVLPFFWWWFVVWVLICLAACDHLCPCCCFHFSMRPSLRAWSAIPGRKKNNMIFGDGVGASLVRGPYCQLGVGLIAFLHWNSAAEEGAWMGLKPDLQGGTGFNLLRVEFLDPHAKETCLKRGSESGPPWNQKWFPGGSSFGPFIVANLLKRLFQVEADLTSNGCEQKLELGRPIFARLLFLTFWEPKRVPSL